MTSKLETEGIVVEALPNAQFKVKLNNGSILLAVILACVLLYVVGPQILVTLGH